MLALLLLAALPRRSAALRPLAAATAGLEAGHIHMASRVADLHLNARVVDYLRGHRVIPIAGRRRIVAHRIDLADVDTTLLPLTGATAAHIG